MRTFQTSSRACWLTLSSLSLLVLGGLARQAAAAEAPVLARVDDSRAVAQSGLPVHAWLQDVLGKDYALVIVERARLEQAGLPFRILDTVTSLDAYVVARALRVDAVQSLHTPVEVVFDDGVQWLVRLARTEDRDALSEAGFALRALSAQPLPAPGDFVATPFSGGGFRSNAWVAEAVATVATAELVSLLSQLTGEEPAAAGGDLRYITSRHTRSGVTVTRATEFAYEYLRALDLNPVGQWWSRSGNTNRNIIGTQPGTVRSNEIVILCAHLDSITGSPAAPAPGADDNASGSVAVLTAASLCRRYQFERTVRYVLFTGEEQGLYGSEAYVLAARQAGDNIVAVLNLDMIAWDRLGGPEMHLYPRSTTHPGYPGDLVIATTFTNVVRTYGLAGQLVPVIIPDSSITASDHSRFWDQNYSAVLAIEAYPQDFCTNYHRVTDRLPTLNLDYYTAFTKAAVGTLAQLAWPVSRQPLEVVRVINGNWNAVGTLGAGVFHARHCEGSGEGLDAYDLPWSALSNNPYASWLKLATQPLPGADLAIDSRPAGGETVFRAQLSVVNTNPGGVWSSNQLRFAFVAPAEPKRIYLARVIVEAPWWSEFTTFLQVLNLREVVAAGGMVQLPGVEDLPDGAIYGACEIASRAVQTNQAKIVLQSLLPTPTGFTLRVRTQLGVRVRDCIDVSTNIADSAAWSPVYCVPSEPPLSSEDFESGWGSVEIPIVRSVLPASPTLFFRLRREWLAP